MAKRQSPIKVCLTNRGKDTETPWADDLGPAPDGRGRLVRLVNVPFLHAKPTWGDIVRVRDTEDGLPTWDRNGTSFSSVDSLIHEDGGRWAMIVDYAPHPDSPDADRVFSILARACAEHDIVCEGAWGPRDADPGRAYLAVKNELADTDVISRLREADLPCELIQVHPAPTKPTKRAAPAKKKTPAKPAAKPAAKKKPTAPAKKKPPPPKKKR